MWPICLLLYLYPYITGNLVALALPEFYVLAMKLTVFPFALLSAVYATSFVPDAHAQIRVDATIHTSAGSCASCDFSKRRMNGMRLQDSDFSKSLFNSANLSGAQFDRANLSEAHFRKALLLRVNGESVNLSGAMFQDATLTEAVLNNSDLKNSDFTRADLTRTTFDTSDFTDSDLSSASASDSNFHNSEFKRARLDHVNFQNSDLREANFENAHFGMASMLGVKLEGAILSGADLSQAQGLRQAELDKACGDSDTLLPDGFYVPYCTGDAQMTSARHRLVAHGHLNPRMARAAANLDDALERLETVMLTYDDNKIMQRELQAIHADIVATRKSIEIK